MSRWDFSSRKLRYLIVAIVCFIIGIIAILFISCAPVLHRNPMKASEFYEVKILIEIDPAHRNLWPNRKDIAGLTFCNGKIRKLDGYEYRGPVIKIKGYKYQGKTLAEDVFALGFEMLNVLHCQHPDQFVNVEKLPNGWND